MEYYIWWVAVVGNIMSCMTRVGFNGDHEARELAKDRRECSSAAAGGFRMGKCHTIRTSLCTH